MATVESEARLIARAQDGDDRAYADLVRGHEQAARRTALAIVRSPLDAEEATQEAFLKAYRALPRFRAGAPFRPWLLKIVANEARNVIRASARQLRISATASVTRESEEPADAAALARIERAALVAALERLPVADRRVLVARYVAGLQGSELSAVLGISPVATRLRIWRALERLRAELAVVGALAVAVAVLFAASPAARGAAGAFLDLIPGVTVTQVDALQAPGPDVAPAFLGEPASVDYATATIAFPLRRLDADPTQVYARNDVQGGMVMLVYDAVSVTEWAAAGSGAAYEVIGVGVERVTVNGNDALWVDEPARAVYTFVGADGQLHKESYKTAGRTLLWRENGVAFRLAGAASLEQALTLAAQL